MNPLTISNQGDGVFIIEGDLTFASIDKKTVKLCPVTHTPSKSITLDLSAVSSTDSAGLALMIEWLKQCRHQRVQLHFKNIPSQLRHLAQLSGFDKTSHFTDLT
jgi:phospholipid transport system transporter-binding protein